MTRFTNFKTTWLAWTGISDMELPDIAIPSAIGDLDLGGTIGDGLDDLGNSVTSLGDKVGRAFALIGEKMERCRVGRLHWPRPG